jgi:hypothetical protein
MQTQNERRMKQMTNELTDLLIKHYYEEHQDFLDEKTLATKAAAFIEGYGYALTMMGLDEENLTREGARKTLQRLRSERML